MHAFLRTRLSRPLADLLTACWYFALIVGVLYAAFEPQADFQYIRL